MTAAARAGNSRWEVIAAACGVPIYEDIPGIIRQPSEIIPGTVATLGGDRRAAVCDECYTTCILPPRSRCVSFPPLPNGGEPSAVIRQRTRSGVIRRPAE